MAYRSVFSQSVVEDVKKSLNATLKMIGLPNFFGPKFNSRFQPLPTNDT